MIDFAGISGVAGVVAGTFDAIRLMGATAADAGFAAVVAGGGVSGTATSVAFAAAAVATGATAGATAWVAGGSAFAADAGTADTAAVAEAVEEDTGRTTAAKQTLMKKTPSGKAAGWPALNPRPHFAERSSRSPNPGPVPGR